MRFLLDHDVPDEIAQVLRHWRHEAVRLREVLPSTSADEAVFQHAQVHQLLIISCNRDHFLGLARKGIAKQERFHGLIVLIRRRTRQAECARLLALMRRASESGLAGNINFA